MNRAAFVAACALGGVVFVALPARMTGQTLAGRIARNGVPVTGAVVNLMDASGRIVARTASREGGTYTIGGRVSGVYTLQVLQIGWRPSVAGPFTLRAGATTSANVDASSARIVLDAMVITDRSECRVHPDSAAAAFIVWEEARKALLSTMMTRAEPLTMSVSRSERTLDRSAARVISDSTKAIVGMSLNPFVTRPPAVLAKEGYVTTDAKGGKTYWGPDADVLTSESFAATHCLRIERPPAQSREAEQLVGVGFAPASKRRDVVDVEGVVWVDRASGELRSLDYRYVNASDAVERGDPRGRVEFLRIPGGRWIADRWSIRVPIISVTMHRDDGPVAPGVPRMDRSTEGLAGIVVTSAQVSEIRRDTDILWERGRVTLAVRVVDSTTGGPIRGTLVGLADAEHTGATATDSTGVTRVERVVPGAVTLRLESPDLASLGLSPMLAPADVPPTNDATITVRVPSARGLVVARCGLRALEWGEGMLRGRSVAGGGVQVSWRTSYARLGGGDPVVAEERRDIATGAAGEFVVCSVPRDATITVRRTTDSSPVTARFAPGAVAVTVGVP